MGIEKECKNGHLIAPSKNWCDECNSPAIWFDGLSAAMYNKRERDYEKRDLEARDEEEPEE